MSAPDFKTLCELAGGSSVATNQDEVDSAMAVRNARLELERRLSPAVMRVVWEALECVAMNLIYFHGKQPLIEARFTKEEAALVRTAIALLNGTTPTDKKDE